jgi:NAD(P)-dependent dehydrogenase (short-subunit alcohol dehydrogenase family)
VTPVVDDRVDHLFDLTGKVAVVTGGAGRLGPIWAGALSSAGAHVVVLVEEQTAGRAELENLRRCHPVEIRTADITDPATLDAARSGILDRHGRIDILVANAGIDHRPAPGKVLKLDDVAPEDFESILRTNVNGTLLTVSTFGAPMVRAGRGSIVVIGSQYATLAPRPSLYSHLEPAGAFVKNPAYGASKAALVQLVRSFAVNWGPRGVRVNALSPGGVRGGQDDLFQRKFAAETPLGRMMEADEVVGPLLFLASDASSYVTGLNLLIDGGYSAW